MSGPVLRRMPGDVKAYDRMVEDVKFGVAELDGMVRQHEQHLKEALEAMEWLYRLGYGLAQREVMRKAGIADWVVEMLGEIRDAEVNRNQVMELQDDEVDKPLPPFKVLDALADLRASMNVSEETYHKWRRLAFNGCATEEEIRAALEDAKESG